MIQSFELLSDCRRTMRPNTIDAADAVATQDIGARELKALKQARISAIIAIAANRYCIIRQNRIAFISILFFIYAHHVYLRLPTCKVMRFFEDFNDYAWRSD